MCYNVFKAHFRFCVFWIWRSFFRPVAGADCGRSFVLSPMHYLAILCQCATKRDNTVPLLYLALLYPALLNRNKAKLYFTVPTLNDTAQPFAITALHNAMPLLYTTSRYWAKPLLHVTLRNPALTKHNLTLP